MEASGLESLRQMRGSDGIRIDVFFLIMCLGRYSIEMFFSFLFCFVWCSGVLFGFWLEFFI